MRDITNNNKYILTAALRATRDRWRPSVETERRLLTKWPQHVPIVISETGAPKSAAAPRRALIIYNIRMVSLCVCV